MAITILSGGQTGIDRAALDFAIGKGFDYGGWCPHGGWAEDYLTPPGLLAKYPQLRETPSASPEQRTAWNVRDSHATMLIVDAVGLACSPGSVFTKLMAELVFLRPLLIVDTTSPEAIGRGNLWLAALANSHAGLRLNIAGLRESESQGIYERAFRFLTDLLSNR